MGCNQSSYALPPNLPAQLIARLIQVSDINHQLNVNMKYQYLCKIDQSKTVGQGLKKTFAYQCLTTKDEFLAKKKEFWGKVFYYVKETRNSGLAQCWNTLAFAVTCKSDDQILKLLSKVKVTPLNGSIQMCVDAKGSKYELPVFVINDPTSFENQVIADRNLVRDYQKCNVKVKIRSVKFPNQDIVLQVSTDDSVEQIKTMIRSLKQLGDTSIRLFYNGREMLDNRALGNYGYSSQTVIQAMIR